MRLNPASWLCQDAGFSRINSEFCRKAANIPSWNNKARIADEPQERDPANSNYRELFRHHLVFPLKGNVFHSLWNLIF
jgi:hypothetical protein